jgi:lipopolysaccharide/colanic/teichoic acid biosynthesis glycosyltransferase
MGWPILFIQQRPGLNGKIFRIYKFRSMLNSDNVNGTPLTDQQRITKLGSFLRKSSIDELPEIFNVLIGDMSFVGPRPLIIKYLPFYSEREKKGIRFGRV